jgi:hypothetical protein
MMMMMLMTMKTAGTTTAYRIFEMTLRSGHLEFPENDKCIILREIFFGKDVFEVEDGEYIFRIVSRDGSSC